MVPTTASWDGLKGPLFDIGGLTMQFRQALNPESFSGLPERWDYRPVPSRPTPHWAFSLLNYFYYFMCMSILRVSVCVCVYHM